MADGIFCAGCKSDGNKMSAGSRCNDCGEPVCNAYAKFHKKLSPPHKIVPIQRVQNLSSTLIEPSRKCEYHPDQNTVLFCCQHDRVLCNFCMSESHQSCKPIISIEKVAKGVKSGDAILDIDQQGQARHQSDQKRLCLLTSFKTSEIDGGVNIHCGCFIPGNRLLLANSYYDNIYVCDLEGSNVRSIELQYNPCAVALYDNNKALVSSYRRFFQIVDLDTLEPSSNIGVGLECTVITCINGNICVRDSNSSLSLVDIDGVEQRKISTTSDPSYISMNKANEIYYIADNDDKVYVTTSDWKERVFYDSPELNGLMGIAVDDNNDVYVSSVDSNAIYRIYRDGQKHDIILNEEDGIKGPMGLSYNDLTKELMVINEEGLSIMIYKMQ
ncbi:uncharacterized protein LOC127711479 [Mytilus californianus]|uniref:uncharacterized protein LOC127711479 n=1 Tax=Mytilus californianus TaxID=6549 RepID=UPI0022451B77|nr:uncharacterized protein LOC127711479 [Mytilus californianus]